MGTQALDIVTILHALSVLEGDLQTTGWNPKNEQQQKVFSWLEEHRELRGRVTGLNAKASRFYEELNAYLTEHKFDPMVDPFDPADGIGVVSILDKLVKWLNGPGLKVEIPTAKGQLPGFELPPNGANIYEIDGYPGSFLLELLTMSDDTLWLFVHDNTTLEGLELVELSMDVMNKGRRTPMRRSMFGSGSYPAYAGAQVPTLDFDVKPDLSWLLGADTTTSSGEYFYIAQAAQQFKMRMDEAGARIKVATVMVTMRGISEKPKVFVLDKPFYGWWTQKGLTIPMAAFFADWDALRKPSGSLEDL